MKQRILTIIITLTLCLCMTAAPAAYASEEAPLQQEDSAAAESVESIESADVTEPQQVYETPTDLNEQESDEQKQPETSVGEAPEVPEGVWSDEEPRFTEESLKTAANVPAQTFAMAGARNVYPTYAAAYEKMIALKTEYPEGKTWTNFEPYGSKGPEQPYMFRGGAIKGGRLGVGCAAFCFILSDEVFGDLPARVYDAGQFNFEDIRVSDFVRVNDSHFVTILKITSSGVIVAEGNYNKSVHWGRAISKEQLMNSVNFLVTRYPEGYTEDGEPETIVASGTEPGQNGSLNWTISSNGVLTITGSGAMKDYDRNDNEKPSWEDSGQQIYSVDIGSGITSVGAYAFYQNTDLMSVSLPDTVTNIGNSAFYGSGLVGVAIPGSVQSVGNDAFRRCTNLASIDIAEGVKTIGERAFHSCTSLGYVDFPRSLTSLGGGAFTSAENLSQVRFMPSANPGSLAIGSGAFTQCWNLNLISLPEGITELPPGAFSSCKTIYYIYIPKTVTTLGEVGEDSPFMSSNVGTVYFGGTQAEWNKLMADLESKPALKETTYAVLSSAKVEYEQRDPFVPDENDPGDIRFCENGNHVGPVTDDICQNCGEPANADPVQHTHNWAADWSSDNAYHWHECLSENCGITENSEKNGYGAHVYDNDTDDTCNTCGYTRTPGQPEFPGHEHIWNDIWSSDNAYHWHECSAANCGIAENSGKNGYGAHNYGEWVIDKNAAAYESGSRHRTCSVCGYNQTEIIPATGSSSSGGGGGSSSSSGSTSTTKNPDGSTTTTKTDSTGTVTETTKKPDGSQTVVETKKDGTVTTKETDSIGNKTETIVRSDGSRTVTTEQKDGFITIVNTDADGKMKTEVKLSADAASDAQQKGETVVLPIEEVQTTKDSEKAPAITVNTGSKEPVKVEIPAVNPTPGTVAVIVHPDGTEETVKTSIPTEDSILVSIPDGTTLKLFDNSKDFMDISPENWAVDAIDFVSARELFTGTTADTFTPEALMTRAMLMTVLARFDGEDTDGGSTWYEKGMDWAVANGISDGSSPDESISREQLVTMLWRYAGSPAVSAASGVLSGFTDSDRISGFAQNAMNWAVENNIISGLGGVQIEPQGQATRAQVAQIMMNFIRK